MKVAFIGMGLRASHIALDFKNAHGDTEFTGFFDPDVNDRTIRKMTSDGTLPARRFDDIGAMFAECAPDLLMIASPNAYHFEHIEMALKSDIDHIFTEKPVVTSIDDTMKLARLIAKYDGERRLYTGLVLRYAPLYRALLSAQQNGHIGEIMSIEASEHIGPYHGAFFMRDWRRRSALSGGFMLEKCCHDLDLYQNLVGSRPIHVSSFGGRKKFIAANTPAGNPEYLDKKHSIWGSGADAFSGDGDIVDYQTALIAYEDGANLAFHTNLNVPDEFRRFCVIGTEGMAEGDFIKNYFRVTSSHSSEHIVNDLSVSSGNQVGHFGADAQMARDIVAYMAGDGLGEKVGVKPALEAGLTAMAIERARETRSIVDMSEIWTEFDDALTQGGATT